MPTPESWQGEAARLSRYTKSTPAEDDGGFVAGRLRTDPRFRAGWNSALWEIHKLRLNGYSVDTEMLMGLAAR